MLNMNSDTFRVPLAWRVVASMDGAALTWSDGPHGIPRGWHDRPGVERIIEYRDTREAMADLEMLAAVGAMALDEGVMARLVPVYEEEET